MSKKTPAQSNPDEPAVNPEAKAADAADAIDETAEDAEPQPMNRAERRAKGKKGSQQGQPGGQPKFSAKGSQGHGHRIWANRRAGG